MLITTSLDLKCWSKTKSINLITSIWAYLFKTVMAFFFGLTENEMDVQTPTVTESEKLITTVIVHLIKCKKDPFTHFFLPQFVPHHKC